MLKDAILQVSRGAFIQHVQLLHACASTLASDICATVLSLYYHCTTVLSLYHCTITVL